MTDQDFERERACWAAIDRARTLSRRLIKAVPAVWPSASAAWEAPASDLAEGLRLSRPEAQQLERLRSGIRPKAVLEEVRATGADLVAREEPSFPTMLRSDSHGPRFLYFRGPAREARDSRRDRLRRMLCGPCVGIVGSRSSSLYGETVAERLAEGLAAAGVTVVSGLALGIDAAAHRGALRGGRLGSTAAVLGCGIDVVYPRANRGLFGEIAAAGVILSEYGPQVRPLACRFPERNRIISGLASVVVIVEGGVRSGAMITARHALDQGRTVLAVPGSVYSAGSEGPHLLISEGAGLATDVKSVLSELGIGATCMPESAPNGHGRAVQLDQHLSVLLAAVPHSPLPFDELAERSRLTIGELNAGLMRLELSGLIRREINGSVYRVG